MAGFLYLHIPFCVSKCVYCDFLSIPYESVLAEKYLDSLCRELTLRKDAAGVLKTVYIGGGTPSLVSEGGLKRLFACLRDNFDLEEGAEITLEANPGTLHRPKIEMLVSLGVTRISIGVQSFNDNELRSLGRIHSSADAADAAVLLRKAGLRNISFDLMYGIPGQTVETWNETLSKTLALSPSHISAYELTPEKNTRFHDLMRSGEVRLPDEELVLDMYNAAIDRLCAAGYEHYEISNFARQGSRCLHNLNYWERGEYIGAGAGAHSFIGGVRSRNAADITAYCDCTDRGIIPSLETIAVTPAEAAREVIFLGLRKTEGISVAETETLGINIAKVGSSLRRGGFLETSGGYLRLTRKGLPVSNAVIVTLFAELGL